MGRSLRSRVLVVVAIAVLSLVAPVLVRPAPAAATPITYNFMDGIRAELQNPGGSLPGTNDFHCEPPNRHPRPVMLLHGTGGGRQTNWATLAAVLVREGYCVFAPTYGALGAGWPASAVGGLGPKVDSSWQVKIFADRVLAATGSDRLDVVGHSQGTEHPTYWMKYLGGAGHVNAYISLAPYWKQGPDQDDEFGDMVGRIRKALGVRGFTRPACPECTSPPADFDFNRAVRLPTPYLPGVHYTNIVTSHDTIVTPFSSGILDGPPGTDVENITVQNGCAADHSDHMSIVANRRSAAFVLNALDLAHPRPVPCIAVPPFTGA
ncbi:esterase/lipase family protein [Gordonia sp. (in: high G+C Gram-positive bacteria)]|uniref:esterase/lipase family protein n=1 Tax=Gordonia sp. (in: high G+C Gram-positive bacteria) TaxID=84139 RepID=UPI003F978580